MPGSRLICPFCNELQIEAVPVGDGQHQLICHNCRGAGPTADSEEQALIEWERLYHEVNLSKLTLAESPDIIFIKNWEGKFLLANDALARLYGTTAADLIGCDDGDFNGNREQVDFYLKNLRDVISSGEVQYVEESSTDSSTGKIHYYLSVKIPFQGPSGEQRILVIAKDVTDLKAAYNELEERENRYAYAMNAAGEGIWDWDIRNDMVTHNMRWCQILGLDESSLQHPVADFIALLHDDDKESVNQAIERALSDDSGQLKYEHEHRMHRANGDVVWVYDRGEVVERDDAGNPLRVVGAIRDIDERKHYEARLHDAQQELMVLNAQLQETLKQRTNALLRNEERFALAMRSANDGLWDWDLLTNEVYYSPRWKSMLGYEEHEIAPVYDSWASLVHPDDLAEAIKSVEDYLSGNTDAFEVEIRMRHKAGHYVFIRSRAIKLMSDATGEATRLIGTHVDITDKKRAENFDKRTSNILEMIAKGRSAAKIYDEIALLYESRHPGMRCSMLELDGDKLLHGGAPSLPKSYCEAVDGLINGPNVGSCGTSTYTGKRVIVENIETDPKWAELKAVALPHGMRCCWSEPIKASSGKVLGAFGMYYDYPAVPNDDESNDLLSAARLAAIVMERENNQKRIRELAYTDALTGLSSRDYFYQSLDERMRTSQRNHQRFSLLYIDLDNFKGVNDSLGHDAGDLLLKESAERLREACRESDFIGRLGGDEFCIIIQDIADNLYSVKVAERCLQLMSQPLELESRVLTPSCSIGIAHYPNDGEDLQALVKAADTALYEAKKLGKNRFAFYETELTDKADQRFRMEQLLKDAVNRQQLSLAFQPQIDLETGAVVGVEALCRWFDPTLGHVPPCEFIEIAEQIGIIKPLTEWVVEKACTEIAAWKRKGIQFGTVAVNISPVYFEDKGLLELLEKVLNIGDITASDLELEVTESVVQTNPDNLSVFDRIKAQGISLAIDDFGSGYSSFSSLKHMNVDVLKIDRHFISEIETDEKVRLLVRSMIEMGHNLGYKIIAEGIETSEQLQLLKQLKCDIGQGYLFSKPASADVISGFLAQPHEIG